MRSHKQIIEAAGGYQALAKLLGLEAEQVRFWNRRGSIPPEYRPDVMALGLATVEELTGRRPGLTEQAEQGATA